MLSFRNLSLATSLLALTLATILLFAPSFIYWVFGVPQHETGDFLAKRAAMLFLGVTVMSYLLRDTPDQKSRSSFSIGMAVLMAGLAATGLYEFIRGFAGPWILLAILTETAFALAYLKIHF